MSEALDQRIDAARNKLINLSRQVIGMGNYKQILRAYQELTLELINVMDELNAQTDKVSSGSLEALKAAAAELKAQIEAQAKETPNG